jgi:hypothetical protein
MDLGVYKTANSRTFHCHFNADKQIAFAFGPLPDLKINYTVEVQDESEARQKLSQEIGAGVFVDPVQK